MIITVHVADFKMQANSKMHVGRLEVGCGGFGGLLGLVHAQKRQVFVFLEHAQPLGMHPHHLLMP